MSDFKAKKPSAPTVPAFWETPYDENENKVAKTAQPKSEDANMTAKKAKGMKC